MIQHSHQTAPTQFVEAAGVRFAYRRFGKTGGVPLVFNQHFTGTMDHWDPLVTDGLAAAREVILPGREPRFAIPVSGALRPARFYVPVRVRLFSALVFASNPRTSQET